MDKIPWKYIGDWTEKKLTCARCGSQLSVKYEMYGRTYCNRCVIPASYEVMRGNDAVRKKKIHTKPILRRKGECMMLEKLVGAQVVRINESSIEVKFGDNIHVLEIVVDEGDCCGFANFDMSLFYEEGSERNPIITNIEVESDNDDYKETAIITFYGENKKIASIEAEAGSESGYSYGACVTLRCKTLDIDETLVKW